MSAEYFHALAVNGILLTQISQPDAVARDICTESDTVRYQNAVIAYVVGKSGSLQACRVALNHAADT